MYFFFTIDEEQTDPSILRDYCRSSSSGRLKNDFIELKKENQALIEKNGFAERDLVLLQEEYDSIKGKLEKCAMANEKLFESNNSLRVRKKIKDFEGCAQLAINFCRLFLPYLLG